MQRDANWHNARSKGIGGSDAAAVLGVSPFKSPLRLWLEKRHEIEPDDLESKQHIYWGTTLERVICEEYTRRTGRPTREAATVAVHPYYPWMLCTVDRYVTLPPGSPLLILEAKNVSVYHFGAADWGPDGSAVIPPYYFCQAQHNCAVTGAVQCDMPVLIGGNDYRCYCIPRNDRFIEAMTARELAFWESLSTGQKPDPVKLSDLKLLFPESTPGAHIDATEDAAAAWAQMADVKLKLSPLVALKKQLEFTIKAEMGTAEHLSFNGVKLATWKTSKSGRRTFRVHVKGIETGDDTDGEE